MIIHDQISYFQVNEMNEQKNNQIKWTDVFLSMRHPQHWNNQQHYRSFGPHRSYRS